MIVPNDTQNIQAAFCVQLKSSSWTGCSGSKWCLLIAAAAAESFPKHQMSPLKVNSPPRGSSQVVVQSFSPHKHSLTHPRRCSRDPCRARSQPCAGRERSGPAEPSASSASSACPSRRWPSCRRTTETSWSRCKSRACRLQEHQQRRSGDGRLRHLYRKILNEMKTLKEMEK